jgi:hypothetical protein
LKCERTRSTDWSWWLKRLWSPNRGVYGCITDRAVSLRDLRHVLAACPRRSQMHDACETVFPDLVPR